MSHAQPTEAHHATLADEKLAAGAEPPATATLDRDESVEDKGSLSHNPLADLRALAEKGQVDEFGRTAIRFDAEAEARLRRKIDWHILPPVSAPHRRAFCKSTPAHLVSFQVALIYLWTFIDRASEILNRYATTACSLLTHVCRHWQCTPRRPGAGPAPARLRLQVRRLCGPARLASC